MSSLARQRKLDRTWRFTLLWSLGQLEGSAVTSEKLHYRLLCFVTLYENESLPRCWHSDSQCVLKIRLIIYWLSWISCLWAFFVAYIYTVYSIYTWKKSVAGSCNTIIIKLEGKLFYFCFKAPICWVSLRDISTSGRRYCISCKALFICPLRFNCLDCQSVHNNSQYFCRVVSIRSVNDAPLMFVHLETLCCSSCSSLSHLQIILPSFNTAGQHHLVGSGDGVAAK